MKNKKAIYFLLPVVLVVWGLIFYKIVFREPADTIMPAMVYHTIHHGDSSVLDTFSIVARYRDPFLGKTFANDSVTPKVHTAGHAITKPAAPPLQWPKIVFSGLVAGKNGRLAIISIADKQYLASTGDKLDSFLVVAIFPDSVVIKCNHEKKTFYK